MDMYIAVIDKSKDSHECTDRKIKNTIVSLALLAVSAALLRSQR
jgi:hypothetical protein